MNPAASSAPVKAKKLNDNEAAVEKVPKKGG